MYLDPASPMTPGMLPGFLITDWDNAGYNKQETWNNVQLKVSNIFKNNLRIKQELHLTCLLKGIFVA